MRFRSGRGKRLRVFGHVSIAIVIVAIYCCCFHYFVRAFEGLSVCWRSEIACDAWQWEIYPSTIPLHTITIRYSQSNPISSLYIAIYSTWEYQNIFGTPFSFWSWRKWFLYLINYCTFHVFIYFCFRNDDGYLFKHVPSKRNRSILTQMSCCYNVCQNAECFCRFFSVSLSIALFVQLSLWACELRMKCFSNNTIISADHVCLCSCACCRVLFQYRVPESNDNVDLEMHNLFEINRCNRFMMSFAYWTQIPYGSTHDKRYSSARWEHTSLLR